LDFEALKAKPLTFGRTNESETVLRDDKGLVSRRQFSLFIRSDDDLVILQDLGSLNGTYINGQRIAGIMPLFPGDIISCGEKGVQLLFVVPIPELGTPLSHTRDEKILPEDPLPGVARLEVLATDLRASPDEVRVVKGAFCRLTPQHPFRIGRYSDQDLSLRDENVSRNHAQIYWTNNGYVIKDLGAANRTRIRQRGQKEDIELRIVHRLEDGDRISIDQTILEFRAPRRQYVPSFNDKNSQTDLRLERIGVLRFANNNRSLALGPQSLLLPGDRQILVGRSDNNDLRLVDSSVSRRHARIVYENGSYQVADLGASNGTLVNQERIRFLRTLTNRDKLKIGDFEFVFEEITAAELESQDSPIPVLKIGEPVQMHLAAATNQLAKPDTTSHKAIITHPLRKIQPFDELDTATFELIAPYFKEVVYKEGQEIAREGSGRGAFFAILEGKVTLARAIIGKSEPLVLAELEAGSIYGERTIFADQPFVNRLTARTFVRALKLDEALFVRDLNDNQIVRTFFEQQVASFSAATWLRGTLLMYNLSLATLREIAGRMRYRLYQPGEIIAKQDAECDEFFLIVGGVAEAYTTDKKANEQVITVLEEGDTFGDGIAARNATNPMSVRAKKQVDCYVLNKADFLSELAKSGEPAADPDILSGLPLGAVLNRIGPFSAMPPQVISQISLSLKTKEFKKGRTIIRQNDEAHAFYIIRSGKVEVSFETSTGERRVDMTLGAGHFFGEAALTGEPFHSHTVKAEEDCVLLTLYRYDFALFKDLDKLHEEFQDSFVKRYRPQRLEGYDIKEIDDAENGKIYRLSKLDGSSYFDLSQQGYFLWKMMDGDNSINDLGMAYFIEFSRLDISYVVKIVRQLQQAGFLKTTSLDETKLGIKTAKKKTLWQKIGGLLYGNREIHNIDNAIKSLYKYFGWVFFSKPIMIVIAFLCSIGFISFLVSGFVSPNIGFNLIFAPPLANFFVEGPLPFWWLWIILFIIASLFIHELGHALAVKHYGHRVLGGGITYVLPVFVAPYVNTNDMYNEPRRGARILVDVAGPIANMLIGMLCSFAVLVAELSGNARAEQAFFQLASISFLLAFFNLFPVMQSDGYYALSTYWRIPNLRKKALVYIRHRITNPKAVQTVKPRERKLYTIYVWLIPLYILITAFQLIFWLNQITVGFIKSILMNTGLAGTTAEGLAGLISLILAITLTVILSFPTVMELLQTSRSGEKQEV
jgi:pSer/pThr/pTyr-binding forkhead associated (FHA) protein/CRP-like cAMP-binding protein/Zn-dependent protease